MLGADLSELAEDVELELGDLGDGLNDHVGRGEVLHLGAGAQKGPRLVGLLLCNSRLGDILGQKLLYGNVRRDAEQEALELVPAKAMPFSKALSEVSIRVTGTWAL